MIELDFGGAAAQAFILGVVAFFAFLGCVMAVLIVRAPGRPRLRSVLTLAVLVVFLPYALHYLTKAFLGITIDGQMMTLHRVFYVPDIRVSANEIEAIRAIHFDYVDRSEGTEIARDRWRFEIVISGTTYEDTDDLKDMSSKEARGILSEFWGKPVELYLVDNEKGNRQRTDDPKEPE
jgi:hypothetical protein